METQQSAPNRPSKVLKWLLITGIVILLNLFFAYAIKVIYPEPKFETFCPREQVTIEPKTQRECVEKSGGWTENNYPKPMPVGYNETVPAGYCDLNFTCQKNFTDALALYNRNVFIALIVLGVLSLASGFFLPGVAAVSLGLSLGGVLSLIVGSMRYWSDMNDYLRVIILGLALATLIALGVKKLRE